MRRSEPRKAYIDSINAFTALTFYFYWPFTTTTDISLILVEEQGVRSQDREGLSARRPAVAEFAPFAFESLTSSGSRGNIL